MIIEWIGFIFLFVFNFFVWFYFFFRATNYHNDRSLNLKRIGAIIYYLFVFGYNFYMMWLSVIHFDPHQDKILTTFIDWVIIINIPLIMFFLLSLKPLPKNRK
ncbi:hypothetical protein B6D08_11970 [Gilliamella apicola]|uniref:Uncharacterized protein n=1 Tax=Gilliamella apicola TaxID=1196095 RepID=A0A2C9XVV1_9GAMM|nr:hypothetical protein B5S40_11390 [Gilliamella apicola]OTP84402.1 hypothetical protein B5S44_10560 [Gilliamella apicola]OTP98211.1 hypothetical protein B6D08_11970 [Gilliamella apicola]OTQ08316.1 hypothetical protein B6C91_12755 [Gilliamella apicola]OTQ16945.1 hypothetical protein B6D11_03075 [Gilliamella apicola]